MSASPIPSAPNSRSLCKPRVQAAGVNAKSGGTYLCMEGPAFSTKAESNVYRSWGMDVIGMTNLQEAKLAREAELCYVTVAMVTDYDCWHPEHDAVTVTDIIANLTKNAENAARVVSAAVAAMPEARECKCGFGIEACADHEPERRTGCHAQEAGVAGWQVPRQLSCSSAALMASRGPMNFYVTRSRKTADAHSFGLL